MKLPLRVIYGPDLCIVDADGALICLLPAATEVNAIRICDAVNNAIAIRIRDIGDKHQLVSAIDQTVRDMRSVLDTLVQEAEKVTT